MNAFELLDSNLEGKLFRNTWNNKLYKTVNNGNGIKIELCDSEYESDVLIISSIEYEQ